jgi:hypothetical protein
MTLRHISPRSSDWVDAMEEGGSRGWDKLGPEERTKLRLGEFSAAWQSEARDATAAVSEPQSDSQGESDYGWEAVSASR